MVGPGGSRSRRWLDEVGRSAAPAVVPSLLIGLLSFAPFARADVYKWYDENGVAHYSTDPDALPAAVPELTELPPSLPSVRAADPDRRPDDRGTLDTHGFDSELIDRFAVYGLPGPRGLPPPRRIPPARSWPSDPDARLALP